MKRGEKPQEGVRQLVINLAGKNPRPTNEAIVEKVKEKFGVPIDEKTIRR